MRGVRRFSSTASAISLRDRHAVPVSTFGTLDYRGIARRSRRGRRHALLVTVGPAVRRRVRQVGADPLYVWLPDAMAGPTPVSALITPRRWSRRASTWSCACRRSTRTLRRRGDRRRRRRDGDLRGDDGHHRDRHQESARLFDGQPARLHVRGRGRGRLHRRDLSPDDARVLQGAVVPGRGKRHPRPARRAGHHEDGGLAVEAAGDVRDVHDGDARHRGDLSARRVLLERRDPLGRLVLGKQDRVGRSGAVRRTDRVLHVPSDVSGLLRQLPRRSPHVPPRPRVPGR